MPNEDKLQKLLRHDVGQLMDYHPVKPLDVLGAEIGIPPADLCKLDANENLYGSHPAVREALAGSQEVAHIYPDPLQGHLLDRLVKYTGRKRDEIVCGAGADELIDLVIRIIMPEVIVTCPPTFAMYKFFALIARAEIAEVPLERIKGAQDGFQINLDNIIAKIRERKAKLVFLASPNNPTGLCVPVADVEKLCEEDSLIVVDEAYIEFAPDGVGAVQLLDKYPNLVIMRTFSKWAGLAGARLGYLLAHTSFVARIRQIKIPYNVSVAAEAAGCAALDHSEEVLHTVQLLREERIRVMAYLRKLGIMMPLPTHSNFVLCEIPAGSAVPAKDLLARLRKKGILLRYYPDFASFGDFMRVSFGRPLDTEKLMDALLQEVPEKRSAMAPFHKADDLATALLWDMDGVLADVSLSYRAAIIQTVAHYGSSVTDEEVHAMKLAGNANNDWVLTHRILTEKCNGSAPSLEEVTKTFQDFYLGGLRDKEQLLIPAARLRALSKQVPMAVVTGRPRVEAEYFLRLHHIEDCFSTLACMEDGCKPDPAPLLKSMAELSKGLNGPQTFFMIGDTVDDIRAAVAAHSSTKEEQTVIGIGVLAPGHGALEQCSDEVSTFFESGALRVFDTSERLLDFIESSTCSASQPEQRKRPAPTYPGAPAKKLNGC
mmetsp:Transcript_36428/g.79693  ORF Transcript_36428/g.79693 Transcript_36428/m.79693 type:complete len:657 (-) Transcript_36428:172-2142(-)